MQFRTGLPGLLCVFIVFTAICAWEAEAKRGGSRSRGSSSASSSRSSSWWSTSSKKKSGSSGTVKKAEPVNPAPVPVQAPKPKVIGNPSKQDAQILQRQAGTQTANAPPLGTNAQGNQRPVGWNVGHQDTQGSLNKANAPPAYNAHAANAPPYAAPGGPPPYSAAGAHPPPYSAAGVHPPAYSAAGVHPPAYSPAGAAPPPAYSPSHYGPGYTAPGYHSPGQPNYGHYGPPGYTSPQMGPAPHYYGNSGGYGSYNNYGNKMGGIGGFGGGLGGMTGMAGYGGYGLAKRRGFGSSFATTAFTSLATGLLVWSFMRGGRSQYYNVYNIDNHPDKVPQEIPLPANAITLCADNVTALCPTETTPLCTQDEKIMCVVTASATKPCTDGSGSSCVESPVDQSSKEPVAPLPCIANATVSGNVDQNVAGKLFQDNNPEKVLCVTTMAMPSTEGAEAETAARAKEQEEYVKMQEQWARQNQEAQMAQGIDNGKDGQTGLPTNQTIASVVDNQDGINKTASTNR